MLYILALSLLLGLAQAAQALDLHTGTAVALVTGTGWGSEDDEDDYGACLMMLSTGAKSKADEMLKSPYAGVFSLNVNQEVAMALAQRVLADRSVVYNHDRDIIRVRETTLDNEPAWLVGYWVRSDLPEYRDLVVYDKNTPIPPGASGPPFVPGGERNVYISKIDGRVLKVEFVH